MYFKFDIGIHVISTPKAYVFTHVISHIYGMNFKQRNSIMTMLLCKI